MVTPIDQIRREQNRYIHRIQEIRRLRTDGAKLRDEAEDKRELLYNSEAVLGHKGGKPGDDAFKRSSRSGARKPERPSVASGERRCAGRDDARNRSESLGIARRRIARERNKSQNKSTAASIRRPG